MNLSIVGGLLIFIASCIAGLSVGNAYKYRIIVLTDFLKYVQYCKANITYLHIDVGETMARFCNENNGTFAAELSKYDFNESSTININEIRSEDNALITDFISAIKRLTTSENDDVFGFYLQKATDRLQSAEKAYKCRGSVAKKLCPLAGLTILILLL